MMLTIRFKFDCQQVRRLQLPDPGCRSNCTADDHQARSSLMIIIKGDHYKNGDDDLHQNGDDRHHHDDGNDHHQAGSSRGCLVKTGTVDYTGTGHLEM